MRKNKLYEHTGLLSGIHVEVRLIDCHPAQVKRKPEAAAWLPSTKSLI